MISLKSKGVSRLRAMLLVLVTFAIFGAANADTGRAVFRPPDLDYVETCIVKSRFVSKLDRDWASWQGNKINLPLKDALLIVDEYTYGSDRVKASPQTALKILDVLDKEYPASQHSLGRYRALALIERAASPDDFKEAEAILLDSYSFGDVRAAMYLGQIYGSRGPTEMRDLAASRKYLQRAAAAGLVEVQLPYARLVGADGKTPYSERINLINNALITLVANIQRGNCAYMYNIGALYMNGELVEKNYNIGLEWLERAAEVGNLYAAEYLASAYQTVRVDQINVQKSLRYLLQAADGGRPAAAFNVGKLYATGLTLAQNRDKAIFYLEKAAKGNVVGAKYWLALVYSGDFNFSPETEKAKKLFAELDESQLDKVNTQETYGKFLSINATTPEEVDRAIELLVKSANVGSDASALKLGDFYLARAETDPTQYHSAVKYFNLAARLGEANGASRLSGLYSCGAGVPLSGTAANSWNALAANLGSENALWVAGLRALASEDATEMEKGRDFVKQAALSGNAEAIGYLVSRLEKGVNGFAKDLDQAGRFVKFVNENVDPVLRHDARLAIIKWRFETASSPEEVQAQLAALDPFVAAGDGDAAISKAEMLEQADMTSPELATKLMKVAADAGDPRGMRNYGKYLLSDLKIDASVGRLWIGMAARKGDVKAKLELVDVSARNATSELDKLAKSGRLCSVDHMVALATKYVAVPDPSSAVNAKLWLENAVAIVTQDAGDMYKIGAAFRDGVAGARERHRAEYYFTRSQALGRRSAAWDLANGHLKKTWTKPDPLKAKEYLTELLEDGDASAGNKLLSEYANETIPATNSEVDDVVNKLQGQTTSASKSLTKLARLNDEAKLGPRDESLVVKWLTIAAQAGDQNAMFGVSSAYINGVGVERSVPTGIVWLQKAADAGNPRAALGLSAAYETGFGLEKDPVKSKYWKEKAKVLDAF